jgi:hypothetical protein
MDVPVEFKYLKSCFWDGSHLEAENERDWVSRALKMSTPQEQKVIKKFLDELLAGNPNAEELQFVWRSGSGVYGLHDDQIHHFFALIRELIEE